MNVEWWGGEQSSPPAEYNSALRRSQALLLSFGIFAERTAFGAYYTASETLARPGHRALLVPPRATRRYGKILVCLVRGIGSGNVADEAEVEVCGSFI